MIHTTNEKQSNRPSFSSLLRRLASPLSSRKVRIALATATAAIFAELGLNVSSELMLAIVGLGASLILGIAHEDAGRNAASHLQPTAPEGTRADMQR